MKKIIVTLIIFTLPGCSGISNKITDSESRYSAWEKAMVARPPTLAVTNYDATGKVANKIVLDLGPIVSPGIYAPPKTPVAEVLDSGTGFAKEVLHAPATSVFAVGEILRNYSGASSTSIDNSQVSYGEGSAASAPVYEAATETEE